MALNAGEAVQVLGRLVEKVGVSIEQNEEFSKAFIIALVSETINDLLKEYSD